MLGQSVIFDVECNNNSEFSETMKKNYFISDDWTVFNLSIVSRIVLECHPLSRTLSLKVEQNVSTHEVT